MIDSHVHAVDPGLPGQKVMTFPTGDRATALAAEFAAAGVTDALVMGRWDRDDPAADPLGLAATRDIAARPGGVRLHAVGVADPTRTGAEHLDRVEAELKHGRVVALKAYLGYVHQPPDSPGYRPYYELAGAYGVPVIFHTGDTYSSSARLRLAHPLLVDDVAVEYPRGRFVIAHVGNPWLADAAAVVYKNDNVWADLSGLLAGDPGAYDPGLRDETAAAVARAYRYAEKPERFLFGSDWPIVPVAGYAAWVASFLPEEHLRAVFEENARELFGLS